MIQRRERTGAPWPARLPRRAPVSVLLLVLLPLAAGQVTAQELGDHDGARASHDLGEAAVLGVNALVGGLTAGLWQELSGGSFDDGFAAGALGGSVAYAGKRVASETFAGAGFLGRQVAATGTSIVRNASDGRGLLDRIQLPVGPLRVYLSPRDLARPRLEVNLHELYWTSYGLADGRLALDAGESLSSGTAVFRSDRPLLDADDRVLRGAAVGGTVFLGPLDGQVAKRTLAHERSHVLQLDFVHHAWFGPLEDHLARKLPGQGLVDRVDYDVVFSGLQWSASALGWNDFLNAPLEAEAEFFESR